MLPPYMTDDENTAEHLISNMDYAGVNGAVIIRAPWLKSHIK
jgi:hypothetical protein